MNKIIGSGLGVVASRLCASWLLLSAACLLVHAQPGVPMPNSPLYGARPETGEQRARKGSQGDAGPAGTLPDRPLMNGEIGRLL